QVERPERRDAVPHPDGFDQSDRPAPRLPGASLGAFAAHSSPPVGWTAPVTRTASGSPPPRVSSQVLYSVAPRIAAPPRRAQAPGCSPCTSQDQTGFSTGSQRRRIEASKAGTWLIP